MKKKPSKNRCGKLVDFGRLRRIKPGVPQAPTNHTIQQDTCTLSEESHMSWQRRVQRRVQRGACRETNLQSLTRLGRLRARSGYIGPTGPPGFPGKCSKAGGNRVPPSPDIAPRAPIL